MFDRKKYKKYARSMLKKRWTIPVIMSIICASIIGLLEFPDFRDFYTEYISMMQMSPGGLNSDASFYSEIRSFLTILIELVLVYAQVHVYIKMSKSPEPVYFKDFIDGFSIWARGILAGLWEMLWTFLWSLLLIIPGIVKHYAYSQTKYLVTEFENLSVTKALRVSIAITRGHKADLFIMDLSFLGWIILSALTCGIGLLWLIPYREMSMINAFHSLLKEAVTSGLITKEDLEG